MAERRGIATHGVNFLIPLAERIAQGLVVVPTKVTTISDADAVTHLDGGNGLGQTAATPRDAVRDRQGPPVRHRPHADPQHQPHRPPRLVHPDGRRGGAGRLLRRAMAPPPWPPRAGPSRSSAPTRSRWPSPAGRPHRARHVHLDRRAREDPPRRAAEGTHPPRLGPRCHRNSHRRPAGGHEGHAAAHRRTQGLRHGPGDRPAERDALRLEVRPGRENVPQAGRTDGGRGDGAWRSTSPGSCRSTRFARSSWSTDGRSRDRRKRTTRRASTCPAKSKPSGSAPAPRQGVDVDAPVCDSLDKLLAKAGLAMRMKDGEVRV